MCHQLHYVILPTPSTPPLYAFLLIIFSFNVMLKSPCTMATLNSLKLCACVVALMMVGVLFISAESTLLVYFKRVPPPRSRSPNAVFQYLVEGLDGSNACKRKTCSFLYSFVNLPRGEWFAWTLSQPKSQRDSEPKIKFVKADIEIVTIVIIGNYGKP